MPLFLFVAPVEKLFFFYGVEVEELNIYVDFCRVKQLTTFGSKQKTK